MFVRRALDDSVDCTNIPLSISIETAPKQGISTNSYVKCVLNYGTLVGSPH